MREFAVWAPTPERVRLRHRRVGDAHPAMDTPMLRGDAGWWRVELELAPDTEVDYGFLLDDDPAVRPDPRSRRQPDGVHGMSRTVTPVAGPESDRPWTGRQLAGGVIYELHIGTFTADGTFDAAIDRLDHLVDLGVDFVEVLPVNAFNGSHNWGYDGVLWYAVQESYGGPAGYQRFVEACHARGLGVIQDVVYNHLGPSGNYLPLFGPYLQSGHANTWGSSVNLDGPGSGQVRRFILDNAAMWLDDYRVDGLRLDAVHALVDRGAVHLLEELAVEVAALSAHVGRPLTLIAESDLNDPRLVTPRQAGGYGLDAQWNDDYHHVLHVALTGEKVGYYADFGSMSAIAKVLRGAYFHDGSWSSFRGRSHGRPVDVRTTPAWAFVGYSQDHDQIGNRATGDRLTASLGPEDLAVAAVMVLAGPFTPMLFMGEEWGAATPWQFFTSHPEPELGIATATGRLAEFERMGWDPTVVPDPQDPATFTNSKLDWSEPTTGAHAELLRLYRELIRLRRCRTELTDPRFDRIGVSFDDAARWLLMDRGGLQVAVNFADAVATIPVRRHGGLLLATAAASVDDDAVELPAHSAVLLAPSAG
ncbi:malto-oligosyltrehalose trehalohydrolase [Nakamurella lactea]|uniref:malto-oligosyltrehalose trehalohydrolase n=1 Tax=Nakamurella lactea TaxID=459515 RepID=UPI00040258A2|nr:malto-oligosyltrehalose trehalohydrolase [Nakamurella lactea]